VWAAEAQESTDRATKGLYEEEPPHLRMRRLGAYLRHWRRWVLSGGLVGAPSVAGGDAVMTTIFFLGVPTPSQ